MPWRTTARRAASSRASAVTAAAVAALLSYAPAYAAQPRTWNFTQIRIGQSQSAGRNGAGVTVAVVDTWVDRTHPEFAGRMLTGADCTGGTCKKGNVAPDGCDAHGTHVAGIVASESYGVAPAARILPLRVLKWDGDECTGTSRDLAAAVRYATANGARVINVSAGAAVPIAGRDTVLDGAVAEAADAGVVVVFAAGNASLPITDSYGDNAVIVAATARDGGLASYSQYGTGIDLAAPGGDATGDTCTVEGCVVSTWSDGSHHQYAALAGTSMAAPHVAGVAALLFAQRSRTRAQVVARLRDTARPLTNAGDGLLDASAALGVSASPKPSAKPPPATIVARPPAKPAAPRPAPTTPAKTKAPSPTPARPTPTPAPSETPAEVPVVGQPPPLQVERDQAASRAIPVTFAIGLLVATAGATVASATIGRAPSRR